MQSPVSLRLLQGPAGERLHHDPGPAFLLDDVVDPDGSDMVDPRGGPGLPKGTRPGLRAYLRRFKAVQQELLDRDRPVQQFVIGEPDPAHAAAAQQRPQPEAPGDQAAAGLAGPAVGQLFRDGRMSLASGAPPAPRAARTPASQLQ